MRGLVFIITFLLGAMSPIWAQGTTKSVRAIRVPMSDLYVVYNETQSTNGGQPSRALIMKMTHSFSF